jgi:hypothetical protein
MTQADSQTETEKVVLAPFDLLEGTSESIRAKTAETFLELLGARVRNPNTRSAYRVAWRSFFAFCSARQLELESVKAYHVGSWLDQHPGSRSTQRQHLAAVRLLFDSLMMRGVVSSTSWTAEAVRRASIGEYIQTAPYWPCAKFKSRVSYRSALSQSLEGSAGPLIDHKSWWLTGLYARRSAERSRLCRPNSCIR